MQCSTYINQKQADSHDAAVLAHGELIGRDSNYSEMNERHAFCDISDESRRMVTKEVVTVTQGIPNRDPTM